MIVGIGTDICDIRRIEALLNKFGDRFPNKVFTKNERATANAQNQPAPSYAKRFAAKEAVAKALAGANTGALSWQDVEVINTPSGRPDVLLHRKALNRIQNRLNNGQSFKVHLSLTDDYPYAQAFAIVEIL